MRTAKGRIFTRYFILICLINLALNMSIEMFYSTQALYVDSWGGKASYTGIYGMLLAIGGLLTHGVAGRIADRHGRVWVLIGGGIIFAVSLALFSYTQDPVLLGVLRFFHGVGFAATSTGANAALADSLPQEHMSEGISYCNITQGIATALAPNLGLWLLATSGFRLVFLCDGAFQALLCLLALLIIPWDRVHKQRFLEKPTQPDCTDMGDEEYRGIWKSFDKRALPATVVCLLVEFAFSGVISFITLYAAKKGFDNSGMFYTLAAVSIIVTRLFVGRAADRFGIRKVLIPALVLCVLLMICLSITDSAVIFILCGAAFGICNGTFIPLLNAKAVSSVPPKRYGVANSTFFISIELGVGAGALFWGFMIDYLNFEAIFLGAATCAALALVLSLVFFKKECAVCTDKGSDQRVNK